MIWKYRLPRLGLTLLLGGSLWTYLAFKVVIPHFYVGVQPNNFWYRYEFLGSTPGGAIINLLTHPWIIFTEIITLDRIYYVFSLIRSTGFLCLLAPEWLIPALPKFASNFLSSNELNYSGVYHYNAAVIPFVMLSAIHGTRRLILLWQGWSREDIRQDELRLLMGQPAPDTERAAYPVAWIPIPIRTLGTRGWSMLTRLVSKITPLFARVVQPLWNKGRRGWQLFGERMYPFTKKVSAYRLQGFLCCWLIFTMGLNYLTIMPQLNSFWATHTPGVREQQIQQLLDLIPSDASVSASDDLNPHLSERQELEVFPTTCLDAPACNQPVEYIIVDLDNLTLANRADATAKLNALSRQYRLLKRANGVELYVLREPA
jgi:hypothetical protein